MKIAVAQIQSIKGSIDLNINKHIHISRLAARNNVDAVFFPELSLTGYEPAMAKELATTPDDERLTVFQWLSQEYKMTIGVGLPTKSNTGIRISLIIFQPGTIRQIYSKQYLHEDELPYFIPGNQQLYVYINKMKIATAICYESLLPHHAEAVSREGADLYVASVAKSDKGVTKAYHHYPEIAKKYAMPVLMANCAGYCDNFQSAGSSAAWNRKGEMAGKLDEEEEGLLIFDTETEQVTAVSK